VAGAAAASPCRFEALLELMQREGAYISNAPAGTPWVGQQVIVCFNAIRTNVFGEGHSAKEGP